MSKALEWFRAGSVVAGTAIAAVNTVIQYNKFRRDQESIEYTRSLQRQAWEKVLGGQLREAKVGDMEIKAPTPKETPDESKPSKE